MRSNEIQIRDPYVYPNKEDGLYYLFGSTDKNIWGKGEGFDVYVGSDLENWEGPYPIFRPDSDFFSEENFWAPEVHFYEGRYYLFATFMPKGNARRGTAILSSDSLLGPFTKHSEGPLTPREWECLDGTFYVDKHNQPWMIFCHEWVQIGDGRICALKLSNDLKETVGEPVQLFSASDAPWPTAFSHRRFENRKNYVTDGPFIFCDSDGELTMIWSSFVDNVYAQGVARTKNHHILGPWEHDSKPLYKSDGGHGMIFKDLKREKTYLTLHTPNQTPLERPIFIEVSGNLEKVKK
ncbi:glycoside hydrolase family 43 protein [Alkalihalobacillus trypoxylicola]|uniref:Glycoside hydrolase n=1 Tax=Alkalihalobacillus trypoxylicola TaxID=519424 RepID=A0A162EMN1_9BACI|nr:glycoside hydrolase family 43 protein [Alkalihalobacillus trypoxylicola]KYG33271.1 glycoside hydrolase [Alkalihalobacillus trypoxylicola]